MPSAIFIEPDQLLTGFLLHGRTCSLPEILSLLFNPNRQKAHINTKCYRFAVDTTPINLRLDVHFLIGSYWFGSLHGFNNGIHVIQAVFSVW